jgi:hypothetical protein
LKEKKFGRDKRSSLKPKRPSLKPSGYQWQVLNLTPEIWRQTLAVKDEKINQKPRLVLLRDCREGYKGQSGFPEPKAWNTVPTSQYSKATELLSRDGGTLKLQKRMTVGKPTARSETRFRRDRITRAYIRSKPG